MKIMQKQTPQGTNKQITKKHDKIPEHIILDIVTNLNPFNTIPQEIILEIISYLDNKSIVNLSKTSKYFNDFIESLTPYFEGKRFEHWLKKETLEMHEKFKELHNKIKSQLIEQHRSQPVDPQTTAFRTRNDRIFYGCLLLMTAMVIRQLVQTIQDPSTINLTLSGVLSVLLASMIGFRMLAQRNDSHWQQYLNNGFDNIFYVGQRLNESQRALVKAHYDNFKDFFVVSDLIKKQDPSYNAEEDLTQREEFASIYSFANNNNHAIAYFLQQFEELLKNCRLKPNNSNEANKLRDFVANSKPFALWAKMHPQYKMLAEAPSIQIKKNN